MTLTRWFALIGVLTVLGLAKVSQQTAIWLNAYALGKQANALHQLENSTQWLHTEVAALQSPTHLVKEVAAQHLQLVAWSELPALPNAARLAQARTESAQEPLSD